MTLISKASGKAVAVTIKNETVVEKNTALRVGGNIENAWDSLEAASQSESIADAQGVYILRDNTNNTDQAWIKTFYLYLENLEGDWEMHFPYIPPDGSYIQLRVDQSSSHAVKFKSLLESISFDVSEAYPVESLPIIDVDANEFTVQMPPNSPARRVIFSMIFQAGSWFVNAAVFKTPTV